MKNPARGGREREGSEEVPGPAYSKKGVGAREKARRRKRFLGANVA